MNRRAIVVAAIAGIVARPALASEASHGDTLRTLIEDVVLNGDTADLASLVAEDVQIPDMDITDIDAFRTASDHGYATREERYGGYTFDIVSLAEADEWAHALVHFTGTQKNGPTDEKHVFYVARFRDGLITELYLG